MASTACIPPAPAPQGAVGLRDRARGALLGLAVGDALGAPAENMKPSEIRARWGRITGYVADRPAGTDDTEYAIFSGLLLARHGAALTQAHVETAWHEWIADREEGPFRGAGFSERGTLENLRRGLAAPISAQHRHAWSDGLAMRAAPHGVFAAGRPAEAARLAAIDGSVSHEGEGIYGGQAVAAGVAAAMAGASTVAVVASALAVVPDDSWTARCLRRAMTAAHRGERAVRSAVVIGGYPWTDLAPEAVALAFGAYAAADGDFTDAVLTAVNMGRDADTTAAVAGALAGATRGVHAIPPDWAAAIGPARGTCLPTMAGHHVLEVADLLTREAPPGAESREGVSRDPAGMPVVTVRVPRDAEGVPRDPAEVPPGPKRVPPGSGAPQPGAMGTPRHTERGPSGTEPARPGLGDPPSGAVGTPRGAEQEPPGTEPARPEAEDPPPDAERTPRNTEQRPPAPNPARPGSGPPQPGALGTSRGAEQEPPTPEPPQPDAEDPPPDAEPAPDDAVTSVAPPGAERMRVRPGKVQAACGAPWVAGDSGRAPSEAIEASVQEAGRATPGPGTAAALVPGEAPTGALPLGEGGTRPPPRPAAHPPAPKPPRPGTAAPPPGAHGAEATS
ncbi:ADP-ribosylglycohydrolase family protein [Streptomyces sp. H23]|uniref:ADP-ribosylglycohydrolase family protein n=1 Tax=Streptomyces sp. H23 TaxID=2541723 RepID=UPI001F10065B|nr:ADP-ribosylglycohydrolase family protein [Streptomyces sp. H23]